MEKLDVVGLLNAAQRIERNVSIALMYSGLRIPQFRLLDWLDGHESATVTEVSRRMGVTRATASVMINELVGKGILVMVENPADRRSFPIHLTDLGYNKLRVARSDLAVFCDQLSARYTKQTIRLLNDFAAYLVDG